jgi:hypothetical protein
MATKLYSSLYGTPPNGSGNIYRGPHGHMSRGMTWVVRGDLVIPSSLGAGDTGRLCDVVEGARLLRFTVVPSADLDSGNTFTFNLGWATAGANTHASASTGLQGTSAFSLSADQLIAALSVPAKGDALEIARVAGSLSAGTLSFIAEFLQHAP